MNGNSVCLNLEKHDIRFGKYDIRFDKNASFHLINKVFICHLLKFIDTYVQAFLRFDPISLLIVNLLKLIKV